MKRSQGFTVVELIIAVLLVAIAGGVFFFEKKGLEAASRDDKRKTAINSVYYNLEEVYYKKNGNYPSAITTKTLTTIDPALLKDPFGKTIGQSGSSYRYDPTGCNGGNTCSGYRLRADLEKESDFVLNSRHN